MVRVVTAFDQGGGGSLNCRIPRRTTGCLPGKDRRSTEEGGDKGREDSISGYKLHALGTPSRKRRGVALDLLSAISDIPLARLPEMHIGARRLPKACSSRGK